jgi:NAD(P)-dependent dehydrogenase (short-subunit alcohol dehydrogenase family)
MKRNGFTEADVPDQSGKCFVVTGANTGLGFEVSRVLAARGARVLLACRDQVKAEAAMARISQASPKANLAFLPFDQADLTSVRTAAELAAKEPRVDVLINNAGVMSPPLMRTKQDLSFSSASIIWGVSRSPRCSCPNCLTRRGRGSL